MPSDFSIFLSSIPKRTREWVHQHTVQDYRGADGKMHPTPVNRRERRAVGKWFGPNTTPYVKPQEDDGLEPLLPEGIRATKTDYLTGHPVIG